MKKHHVIAFLLGWLFSLFVAPATLLGFAKGVVSPARG